MSGWKVKIEAKDARDGDVWFTGEKVGMLKPTIDSIWADANKSMDFVTDEIFSNTKFTITAEKTNP